MSVEMKQSVRQIVKNLVSGGRPKRLGIVKDIILKNLQEAFLSSSLEDYVDFKFLKYCLVHLEKKFRSELESKDDLDLATLTKLLNNLQLSTDLYNLTIDFITTNVHYGLIKNALETKGYHNTDQETVEVLNRLKSRLVPILKVKGDQLATQEQDEVPPSLQFLTYLLDYLTDFKTQFVSNLDLKMILGDDPAHHERMDADWKLFKDLYSRNAVEFGNHHLTIIERLSAEKAKFSEATLSIAPEWEDLLKKFAPGDPFTLEKNYDGYHLIVSQPVIVLSKVRSRIEDYLQNGYRTEDGDVVRIDQVQFQSDNVFYIDTYLDRRIWHGRNICVMASLVWCVADDVSWDVSGEDGVDGKALDEEELGDTPDGRNGEDGGVAESGGNVSFIAREYRQMDRLQIHSSGGNGGNGGAGGNGKDGGPGLRGKGVRMDDMAEFMSPVRFIKSDDLRCVNIVKLLRERSEDIKTENFMGFGENGQKLVSGLFACRSIFMQGMFRDGIQYEFSFSQWELRRSCVYLLITGQRGSLGTQGGLCGLGGRAGIGGYPGKVEIVDLFGNPIPMSDKPIIITHTGQPGQDGEDGIDGAFGATGEDGLDFGYMDDWGWSKVKYFQNGKFLVRPRSGRMSKGDKVWCQFSQRYKSIERYKPEPRTPRVIQRRAYAQRRSGLVALAQKKTAIDMEQALQASAILQQQAISVQDFRSRRAITRWESVAKSAIQAQTSMQGHKKSNEAQRNIKTDIIRPTYPITENISKLIKTQKKAYPQSPENDESFFQDASTIEYYQEMQKDVINLVKAYLDEHATIIREQSESRDVVETFLKTDTTSGADSALFAICGDVRPSSPSLSSEWRSIVSKELAKFLGSQQSYDEETRDALSVSLTTQIEDRRPGDIRLDQASQMFGVNLKKFYDNLTTVKMHGQEFKWDQLDHYKASMKEYAAFLGKPTIPFLKSDLVLIAKARDFSIQYFQENPEKPGEYQATSENVNSSGDETKEIIRLSMDDKGNFCRIFSQLKPDQDMSTRVISSICEIFRENLPKKDKSKIRSIFNKIVSQLFCPPGTPDDVTQHYSTIAKMWSLPKLQLFFYFVLSSKSKNVGTVKMAFLQISQAMMISRERQNTFLFVVVAHPLSDWSGEMCLLLIQDLCGFLKAEELREHISKLPSGLLLHLTHLLQNTTIAGEFHGAGGELRFKKFLDNLQNRYSPFDSSWDFSCLSKLSSSDQWYHQLGKLRVIAQLKAVPGEVWNEDGNRFSQAFYYFYHLFDATPTEALEMLDLYSKTPGKDGGSNLNSILTKFYSGHWSLDEDTLQLLQGCGTVQEWHTTLEKLLLSSEVEDEDNLKRLSKQIRTDHKTTLTFDQIERLMSNINEIRTKMNDKWEIVSSSSKLPPENFQSMMKQWMSKFKRHRSGNKPFHNVVLKAVRMIDHVICRFLEYRLRDTQMLTILATLQSEKCHLLAQVRTGEGKSWIVLAVAIVRGLFDQKTDIVTSSSVLAQRDANDYRKIYEAFGLTVGHVTMESQQQRQREYQKTVVYGEVTHFQRDFLVDKFYGQNTRGSRKFQNIIIDEVDSMFLDKGNSVLYLSHTPPSLDTLEHIFLFIWNSVVTGVNHGTLEPMQIYEHVMESIYPTLEKDDLEGISLDVRRQFQELKILSKKNRIILANVPELDRFNSEVTSETGIIKALIHLKLRKKIELYLPAYLKPFVKLHLPTWIRSAYQATQYQENVQYVLHVDRLNQESDKNPKITIMDLDTGVDLKESQWSDGLHQFLQLKHGCKLTSISLKSVFVSNITFFTTYPTIFGLTGTLGTDADRDFLMQTYTVDLLLVPTALPRRFTEDEPILCSEITWAPSICQDISEKVNEQRSVLVLCETVRSAELLYGYLIQKLDNLVPKENFHLYRRDFEPFSVTANKKELSQGNIIVATNLAGRGTDIKLTESLQRKGGLHVIFSYLPNNARVWWQGFGRAARCGDPGSGRLIFVGVADDDQDISVQRAIDIMIDRDHLEIARVSDIRTYYNNVVFQEEQKFEIFRKHFDKFSHYMDQAYSTFLDNFRKQDKAQDKLLAGHVDEIKDIVKYSMLDDWAFWLDKYSRHLVQKSVTSSLDMTRQERLKEDEHELLKTFIQRMDIYGAVTSKYMLTTEISIFIEQIVAGQAPNLEQYATEVVHEPALLVKLAQCYISRNNFKEALKFLTKIPDENSLPSFVAQYYKIYCALKVIENGEDFISERASELISNLEIMAALQLEIPNSVSTNQFVNEQRIVLMQGLRRQKETAATILFDFRNSLEDLIGKRGIDEVDFVDIFEGRRAASKFHVAELVDQEKITLPKITGHVDPENLQRLAMNYSIFPNVLARIFLKYKGKELKPEVLKQLKQTLNFPSKRSFWKEIEEALEDPVDVAVILTSPKEIQKESSESEEKHSPGFPPNYFHLWSLDGSYSDQQFFVTRKNTPLAYAFHGKVVKGSKSEFNENPEFLHFKRRGLAWLDTAAWINPEKLRKLKLKSYNQVSPNDLKILPELDDVLVNEVFQECVRGGILDEDGIPQISHPEISFHALQSKELPSGTKKILRKIEHEISTLISITCCYQLEKLRLLEIMEELALAKTQNSEENFWKQLEICNLPNKPFHKFIFEAVDLGLIENTKITQAKKDMLVPVQAASTVSGKNFLERLQTSSALPLGQYITSTLQSGVVKPTLTRKDIQILYPKGDARFIENLYLQMQHSGFIQNSTGIIIAKTVSTGGFALKPSSSDLEKFCFPDILPIAYLHVKKSDKEVAAQIDGRLKSLTGYLPERKSCHLQNILERYQSSLTSKESDGIVEYQQEIEKFRVNGFDKIICKNVGNQRSGMGALGALVLSTTQALAGDVKFNSENCQNHDIIYSLLTSKSDTVDWSQWPKYRILNISIMASATGDFIQRNQRNQKVAFIGKSLSSNGSTRMTTDFTQEQEFSTEFGSHLECFVNTIMSKIMNIFGSFVKGKIENSEPLENAVIQLLTTVGSTETKEARQFFLDCNKKGIEKTFKDCSIHMNTPIVVDHLLETLVNPALKEMKRFERKEFYDEGFSQLISKSETMLDEDKEILLSSVGLTSLVSQLIPNVEREVGDNYRRLLQKKPNAAQATATVALQEADKQKFVKFCRDDMVRGVNDKVTAIMSEAISGSLFNHGMHKILQFVRHQQNKALHPEKKGTASDTKGVEYEQKFKQMESYLEESIQMNRSNHDLR